MALDQQKGGPGPLWYVRLSPADPFIQWRGHPLRGLIGTVTESYESIAGVAS